MKRRWITLATFISILVFSFMSTLLWAGEPGNLVIETIDRGMAVLRDPDLSKKEMLPRRQEKLWEEISPIFDFEEMSKRALGKYWKERTPEEKTEFVGLFANILKKTYVGKTDAYAGESVEFVRERQSGNRSKVQTNFITKAGQEIAVDFNLINKTGNWEIYDMIIEGISLVNNYRSQFNSILLKSSYEKLIEKIKDKG